MIKPRSIVRFEQLYWLSYAIAIIVQIATWRQRQAMLDVNPMLANMRWFLPATLLTSILIAVGLWYLTVRRASAVGKWIIVVLAALSILQALGSLYALAIGTAAAPGLTLVNVLVTVIYLAATVLLFRPDARAFFGEPLEEVTPE